MYKYTNLKISSHQRKFTKTLNFYFHFFGKDYEQLDLLHKKRT